MYFIVWDVKFVQFYQHCSNYRPHYLDSVWYFFWRQNNFSLRHNFSFRPDWYCFSESAIHSMFTLARFLFVLIFLCPRLVLLKDVRACHVRCGPHALTRLQHAARHTCFTRSCCRAQQLRTWLLVPQSRQSGSSDLNGFLTEPDTFLTLQRLPHCWFDFSVCISLLDSLWRKVLYSAFCSFASDSEINSLV